MDIGFYLKPFEESFKNVVWQNINIQRDIESFNNQIGENHNQELLNNEMYRNRFLVAGQKIIYAYYMRNKDEFPENMEAFVNIYDAITEILHHLSAAWSVEEDNSEAASRSRRWQVHPINQLREMHGFYRNILPELKKYRK